MQGLCSYIAFQLVQHDLNPDFCRPFESVHVVSYTHYSCASCRVTWWAIPCQILLRLARIWRRRTDRMTSIRYLEWLHWRENARARSVILIFAIFNVFHKRQSTRNTFLPKFDNYLAVHEVPEHINYSRTYRSAWTVLFMETCFSFR